MKQTAVEFLEEQLNPYGISPHKTVFEQAKEMEKQQIVTAYNKAVPFKFGKEYYNETFKK